MSGSVVGIIAKTEWKQQFVNATDFEDGVFEGFNGIDELTDYDLVQDILENPKTNKRRAETDDDDDEIVKKKKVLQKSERSEPKLKGKKKKKKKKKNDKNVEEKVAKSNNVAKMVSSYDSTIPSVTLVDIDAKLDDGSDQTKWRELLVPDPVLRALKDLGFLNPTPIQALTLPAAIRDRLDIVGAAETGSGKTLAFGIPIINHIVKDRESEEEQCDGGEDESKPHRNLYLRCLIVTPTRELAIQVKNHLVAIAKYANIKIMVVVGGMSRQKQERLLKRCPEIIVGTPGRLWELIKEGNNIPKADEIRYLVIDEADRMVEKGHFEELSDLLDFVNGNEEARLKRQVFVFSATLSLVHEVPKRLMLKKQGVRLTKEFKLDTLMSAIGLTGKPKIVDITRKAGTVETLQEGRINCSLEDKDFYLYYFLTQHRGRTIVFCNSIDCVRRLTNVMTILRLNPHPLHASMHQKQRLKNLERFSANENGILVTTDVAQRGLDIPNVDHIIHYQVPRTSEGYVHRSGRTARASKEGISIIFIEPNEMNYYLKICKTLGREADIPQFPIKLSVLKEVKRRVILGRSLDQLEHRFKRLSSQNNWFQKTAKEMDIELDDNNLNDLGDRDEIAAYHRLVKSMRQQLDSLLRQPILPKGVLASKFPATGTDLNTVLSKSTNTEKAISIMKRENTDQKQLLGKLGRSKTAKEKKLKKYKSNKNVK